MSDDVTVHDDLVDLSVFMIYFGRKGFVSKGFFFGSGVLGYFFYYWMAWFFLIRIASLDSSTLGIMGDCVALLVGWVLSDCGARLGQTGLDWTGLDWTRLGRMLLCLRLDLHT